MNEISTAPAPAPNLAPRRRRRRFLGLSADDAIKAFFGGNAFVSVVVLTLITIFLVREGIGFFGQNHQNLQVYRRAGLEYVDIMRAQLEDHTALTRYLSDLRVREFQALTEGEKLTPEQANARLEAFDTFANQFSDTVVPLRGIVSDLTEQATALKEKFVVAGDRAEEREQLLAEGKSEAAAAVKVDKVDFAHELQPILGTLPMYRDSNREFAQAVTAAVANPPTLPQPELQARMTRFQELAREYVAGFPAIEARLAAWDYRKQVPGWQAFTAFVFGRQWLTASFWQDWYGVLPLFVGSLMVSFVALLIAVPLGIGAAIYVNQMASPWEQRLIKPVIEFISAIPSVVLGFFGIAILGQALRTLSQQPWLSWVPGFPYSERLNILTAGCLLALIAVPTIFTLAEDALNNVPRAFKEASFALGASRLQTIMRIIVPAGLSGLVSAVLLGFGRVIGETMVVLLCAGNRIEIPDFTAGLAVVTQPVHTMTGIIAQEMGEVVRGSIHYRALFVVGLVLFLLSLLINFAAQKVVRRYRISIG
ncbi:phosphate ABC transporter permease subunit PstC [Opitutus sp. ER46]|uniref:phosphate ABC transporter permease subunit PstC n=1 Tax=Opitutus sp. ER46 TaxID=2161864 RepID=UPI000D31FC76|nr:phosphate ABC transporter permease subunit PstC [Opitutus sp. ER46]PTY01098.1 phosphate ABC transporter permease subunit PstC [Opitutus sp. ER46]